MKRIIATKQLKRWQKIDRLVFAAPPLTFLLLSLGDTGRRLWGIVMSERNPGVTAAVLLLMALATAITSFPVILIWRAVSHTVKKTVIQRVTFQTSEDLEYYREKLSGLSPTTISLLMDLQIETKKDVSALILKFMKAGAVSVEGGAVHVLNSHLPGLTPSDKILLELVERGQAQPANLGAWKKQAITEAIQSGNIKQRGAGQNINAVTNSCVMGCFTGCLLPVLLLIGMCICAVAFQRMGWLDAMDSFMEGAPQAFGAQQMDYFLASPDMVVAFALMVTAVLPLFVVVWLPIAAALRMALSVSRGFMWLKRTREGELLTAHISGMKNFIRDFSNLSEAEKEHLLLWDDFLIYAVVLEENERITEDIFSMKNLRYGDFKLF